MTPEEWFAKAMWEGGLVEGFNYGLKPSDFEFEDTALGVQLARRLKQAYVAWQDMQRAVAHLEEILPEGYMEEM